MKDDGVDREVGNRVVQGEILGSETLDVEYIAILLGGESKWEQQKKEGYATHGRWFGSSSMTGSAI